MVKLLSVVVALLVAVAPASAAVPKRHRICGPKAAKTVARTERLRVYAVRARYGVIEYVCSRYSKRRWELTGTHYDDEDDCFSSQGCTARTQLLVAGRWVLEVIRHDGNHSYAWIHLRAAGARRYAATTTVDRVDHAVLRRDGGVAWIESYFRPERSPGRVVARFGGCGERLLDEGDDIDPASLRLGGDGVTWGDAGGLQTASLCPPGR